MDFIVLPLCDFSDPEGSEGQAFCDKYFNPDAFLMACVTFFQGQELAGV